MLVGGEASSIVIEVGSPVEVDVPDVDEVDAPELVVVLELVLVLLLRVSAYPAPTRRTIMTTAIAMIPARAMPLRLVLNSLGKRPQKLFNIYRNLLARFNRSTIRPHSVVRTQGRTCAGPSK
jgi:hypothetical protein